MDYKNVNFSLPVPYGGYDIKPAVNTKCIVFTSSLALGYWFLPQKNKLVLLALAYFPYLFLSYYDVKYQAARNMGPTYLANFYDFAKVQSSNQIQIWKYWAPKWKNRVRAVDLGVAVLVSVFLYYFISWQTPLQKTQTKKEKDYDNLKALAFIGICLAVCVYCRLFLK